ncbi:MAG: Synechococcus phage [Cyanobacteriota bacterium]
MKIDELLSSSQQQEIKEIAIAEYEDGEKECCGFILATGEVLGCQNQSSLPQSEFVIPTALYAANEKKTGIKAIFHSHTNGNPKFSAADVDLCHRTQKPLVLYDVHRNEFSAIDPSGKTPLIGRDFVYGIYDCFSLVRDYYAQNCGIKLPDYPRSSDDCVWEKAEWDWIDREYAKVGFREVKEPKIGDVIAMSVGGIAPGINHLAIYLGDDKFLHQRIGRKSNIEVWGHPWVDYTIKFLRYGDGNGLITRSVG